MTQHTPEPWTIRRELTADAHSIEIDAPSWAAIATVVVRINGDSSLSGEANARLIAAAPKLLAALGAMVAEFDKFSRYGSPIAREANEAMRAARAAIAKATAP